MIRCLCLVLTVLGGSAAATQDRWPALFDVANVAADDVLNVRAGPSADTAIIGTLSPDAQAVEVVAPNPRETWGRINLGETTGWVSLRYMARRPGQWLGAPIDAARCMGTEPFWSLSWSDGAVTWSTPETSLDGARDTTLASLNRRDVSALLYRLESGARGHALLRLGACSDGMSDRAFGISVSLTQDLDGAAQLFTGCCTLETAP